MKHRTAALISAVIMALSLCGCEKKNSSNKDDVVYGDSAAFEAEFENAEDVSEGPLLTLSNTTVKAGGTAEVTISVKNTGNNWTMCGLHIAYPDLLGCVMDNAEEREPKMTLGDAVKGSAGAVARLWSDNLPEKLSSVKKKSVFFTSMFSENNGGDGDLVTFYFNVPADAKSGTVYDFDFYYFNSDQAKDMFRIGEENSSAEKYAFTHWQGGSVTVE